MREGLTSKEENRGGNVVQARRCKVRYCLAATGPIRAGQTHTLRQRLLTKSNIIIHTYIKGQPIHKVLRRFKESGSVAGIGVGGRILIGCGSWIKGEKRILVYYEATAEGRRERLKRRREHDSQRL